MNNPPPAPSGSTAHTTDFQPIAHNVGPLRSTSMASFPYNAEIEMQEVNDV